MIHGANIYKYAKAIGTHEDEIIDFSSNINLYQPEINLTLCATKVARYADTSYKDFKKFLANKYAIKKSQIALYNGATSAIEALLSHLKKEDVFLYAPLYGEYEKAALKAKKNIYKINRLSDTNTTPLKKSIVVFVNPSTPEGKYEKNIKKLLALWIELECTIIIDESFLEFEDLASIRNAINNYKELYIIHSFSKFYSCAGVRVGAIFSDKKNIQKLLAPLWNISSLDIAFLQNRLRDRVFTKKTQKLHKKQKQELQNILKSSKLFDEICLSDANFILTHASQGKKIFAHLLAHKILVRCCGSFDYLSDNWLRFAVKDSKSHQKLQGALHELS